MSMTTIGMIVKMNITLMTVIHCIEVMFLCLVIGCIEMSVNYYWCIFYRCVKLITHCYMKRFTITTTFAILHTVKPPNRGHFGDGPFVPCREVVLFSEVLF